MTSLLEKRRSGRRLLSVAMALAALLSQAACRRSTVARDSAGPTPEEQGFLPSDFRAHVEFVTEGAIDWANHRYLARISVPVVEKTTAGEPVAPVVAETRAYDAAALAASRVFLTLAAGIRVDARDTLSNLASDEGTLRLWGNIQQRRLLRRRRLRNGDLECLFEVPMLGVGGVVSQLYSRAAKAARGFETPPAEGARRSTCGVGSTQAWAVAAFPSVPAIHGTLLAASAGDGWDMAWVVERPKDVLGIPLAADRAMGYGESAAARRGAPVAKGLAAGPTPAIVIDARGSGVLAALFPVVKDETGRVVYSAARADRDAVVNEGLVQYVELAPAAALGARSSCSSPGAGVRGVPVLSCEFMPDGGDAEPVAGEPRPRRRRVVLKAKTCEGPLRANIIVSREDAARLESAGRALEEARVIVVTDTSIGGVEGLLRPGGRSLAAAE